MYYVPHRAQKTAIQSSRTYFTSYFPFSLALWASLFQNIEIKTLIDGETNPNPFRLEQHILWKPQIYKTFEKYLNFCQH